MFTNSTAFLQDLIAKLVPATDEPIQDSAHRSSHRGQAQPPTLKGEHFYRDKLAMLLNGRVDVATPTGKIVDILTAIEVIEVKSVDEWRAALDQIRIYGQHYPLHRRRIHLYGHMSPKKLLHIQQHCFREGVVVTGKTNKEFAG